MDATERAPLPKEGEAPEPVPYLFLLFSADAPERGGARFSLADVHEVTIRRADVRATAQKGKSFTVALADKRVSTEHARIFRDGAHFVVEDLGSTNGTFLSGERVSRARMHDGDVLEFGQTLFLFRTSEGPALSNVESASLSARPMGLRTLDPELERAFARLSRVATAPIPVLVLGESGTGKEWVARAVHQLSGRPGPLVPVNCGALPQGLVESQLFGHVKGAFSGALRDEPGFVRASDQGTLFLDEIGELPLASQATLLRVLQEGEVVPVGASRPIEVDLRVVCATHVPLAERVASGAFRQDLFARLRGFSLDLPPLASRLSDLGLLMADIFQATKANPLRFEVEAARALAHYGYPHNIRELRQCLETARALTLGERVTLEELPAHVRSLPSLSEEPTLLSPEDQKTHDALVQELKNTRGNVSEVARNMGKARQQIQRWLRRFALDPQKYK